MELHNVLEIGFGGNPLSVADWHPEGRGGFIPADQKLALLMGILPERVNYVGIDFPDRLSAEEIARFPKWCRGDVSSSRRALETYGEDPSKWQRVSLQEMDARQMRFADGYFQEVQMHYVLTDPSLGQEDAQRIVSEARRVLQADGVLIVTGERHRLNKKTQQVDNLEDKARRLVAASGFSIDDREGSLERNSLLAQPVRRLYEHRLGAVDFSSGVDPEAYLLIAK